MPEPQSQEPPASLVAHSHVPVYRVVRRLWADPLDASFSQTVTTNRWNTETFPALYCCCSETVAAAVVRDRLRRLQVELEDLTPDAQPSLVEVEWSGTVIDVASEAGVVANGFDAAYPARATTRQCQLAAARWHEEGREGVVCRSASLHRVSPQARWDGEHQAWGELAIFPVRAQRRATLRRRRRDLHWLQPLQASG